MLKSYSNNNFRPHRCTRPRRCTRHRRRHNWVQELDNRRRHNWVQELDNPRRHNSVQELDNLGAELGNSGAELGNWALVELGTRHRHNRRLNVEKKANKEVFHLISTQKPVLLFHHIIQKRTFSSFPQFSERFFRKKHTKPINHWITDILLTKITTFENQKIALGPFKNQTQDKSLYQGQISLPKDKSLYQRTRLFTKGQISLPKDKTSQW